MLQKNPSRTPLTFIRIVTRIRGMDEADDLERLNECDEEKIFHVPHVIVVDERVRVDVN